MSTFDRSDTLTVTIKNKGTVTVRYPSDQQIIDREKAVKTFYKKGSSIPDVEGEEEANEALYKQVFEKGDEMDESGSSRVLNLLLRAIVEETPERVPGGYSIKLSVTRKVLTVHVLKEPSEKQLRKYRKDCTFLGDLKFGRQEAKSNLPEIGKFYDSLFVSVGGYSVNEPASIPLSHKVAVVQSMLSQMRAEEEEDEIASTVAEETFPQPAAGQ